jgi:uncharacterized membrane protein YqiK
LPLIVSVVVSIIAVQFFIEPLLRKAWGDGILVVSGFIGLGISKLWVKHLDRSGKSARLLEFIGAPEGEIR